MLARRALLFLLVVCCLGLLAAGVMARGPQVRDGVFIHLSNGPDEPHRVLMALNMAAMMAQKRDVLVYCDIKGIEVVLKDAEDITFAHFPSSKKQLANLRAKGITVMACPGCLKAAGRTAADLMPGVRVADGDRFFSFTRGRILTLDY